MPTRSGIATAVSAVLCLVLGRVFGIFEFYVIAAAMFALVGCAWVWVVLNWRSLEVSRVVNPARLHAGGTSTVTLTLSNRRIVPTPVARITDEVQGTTRADAHVPPLRRHTSTRASYRVPTERRGLILIGPMRTRVVDPFGLASSTRTSAGDARLLVLPRVDVIAPPHQPGGSVAVQTDRTPNRTGSNGEEFSSLRPYARGDDLRKVHWATTARLDELVVRTELIPEHGHSMILLDVRAAAADDPTFELMVSATASIAFACHKRGDHLRLITTAGLDITADNSAEFDDLIDQLALIEQTPSPMILLPPHAGRSRAETGAMVVANDAESLIASMSTTGGGARGSFVVRFHPKGAKPQVDVPRLPSSRMIDVHPGDDFAIAWARTVGIATARAM